MQCWGERSVKGGSRKLQRFSFLRAETRKKLKVLFNSSEAVHQPSTLRTPFLDPVMVKYLHPVHLLIGCGTHVFSKDVSMETNSTPCIHH